MLHSGFQLLSRGLFLENTHLKETIDTFLTVLRHTNEIGDRYFPLNKSHLRRVKMNAKHAEFIPASGSPAIDAGSSPVRFRDLTPRDQSLQRAYFNNLSTTSRRARFMSAMPSIPDRLLDELSSIDGRRHVAIAAETYVDGVYQMIAEARYIVDEDRPDTCEFAISVDDAWQGIGMGKLLLTNLERKACSMGIETMVGEMHYNNKIMSSLARRHGFNIDRNDRDASARILSKSLPSS